MAQQEEITIDQGTDVTIKLELVDIDGNKKNLLAASGLRLSQMVT